MRTLNKYKAKDIYGISPAIIKDLADFLSPTLTELYNKAIDENNYPDPLKTTKLIELYKAKDPSSPVNYRPISLLPIIAKLFDTIINKQIMEHLTTHNIISHTQYAFRPNSNCTMTLQAVINNIKASKKACLAIFIDLSKAYDTVSHSKLLEKLKNNFNFNASTISFFKSYLSRRTQSLHTQHAPS